MRRGWGQGRGAGGGSPAPPSPATGAPRGPRVPMAAASCPALLAACLALHLATGEHLGRLADRGHLRAGRDPGGFWWGPKEGTDPGNGS